MTRSSSRAAIVGAVLLGLSAATAATWNRSVENFSCDGCRNRRRQERQSVLFVPLAPKISVTHDHASPANHEHDWRLYSRYSERGFNGMLGRSFSTEPQRYSDGARASALAGAR